MTPAALPAGTRRPRAARPLRAAGAEDPADCRHRAYPRIQGEAVSKPPSVKIMAIISVDYGHNDKR